MHTFQFWFDAVEGYLPGTEFGHAPDAQEPPMEPDAKRRLISVLCICLVGEAAALEGASGLIAIAPSRHAQVFLATQVVDEARHVEVFVRRLRDLGVTDPDAEIRRCADPSLLRFKKRLLDEQGIALSARHPVPAPARSRRALLRGLRTPFSGPIEIDGALWHDDSTRGSVPLAK